MLLDFLSMIRNRKKILVFAVILATFMSAFWEVYLLRIQSSGQVLWSRDQAYLFAKVTATGRHLSALRFPWLFIKESLGAVGPNLDSRATLIVIIVTAAGVEKHTLESEQTEDGVAQFYPFNITPIEDRIYAICHLGGLCRWEGDHFERASRQEKEKYHDISLLTSDNFENDGHGWSRTLIGAGVEERKLAITIGDGLQLSIDCTGIERTGSMSVNLRRLGKTVENVGYFESLNGEIVSRARYLRAFALYK